MKNRTAVIYIGYLVFGLFVGSLITKTMLNVYRMKQEKLESK